MFAEAPVLVFYNSNYLTEVEVDTFNFTTGRVLSQKGNNSLWHLIAYRSKTMNALERNYEIYNKEFIMIIQALKD